ncbi:DUF3558 family protein [Gordonia sp. (in: high G+C Gram-positive bacteria)]|uniref:DUF3558 family protein n=1 Tax=Gordonia sp. (in: high G+C Gram-positive bacteria) TaxID=84139 RepID=UPI0039E4DF64
MARSGEFLYLRTTIYGFIILSFLSGCGQARVSLPNGAVDITSGGSVSRNVKSSELPFKSTFTKRWNNSNDGTRYEPCTALDSSNLYVLGIDSSSVEDAAGTDGQTLRGCRWRYRMRDRNRWSIAQVVANSESLENYKHKYSTDYWHPDLLISGRTVGVTESRDLGECMTYVQSGHAGVSTLVIRHGISGEKVGGVCDRAIAFTRATISMIPR